MTDSRLEPSKTNKKSKKLQKANGQNKETTAVIKNERRTIFKLKYLLYLVPNLAQAKLIVGCLISICLLNGFFYFLYGYEFLYETYLYHLIRKDTRHNFSLYFYLQYLSAGVKNVSLWQKVLTVFPRFLLIVVFSVRYGLNRLTLNFAILVVTIAMVAYNTVLTSQYFVWILAVLPLCLWQIRMSGRSASFLTTIWLAAQAAWLLPAYFLEFQGQNTFMFVWIQGVSFFCANMLILGRIIKSFMPTKAGYKVS